MCYNLARKSPLLVSTLTTTRLWRSGLIAKDLMSVIIVGVILFTPISLYQVDIAIETCSAIAVNLVQ
jgi:hypothetical protein